MTSTYRGNAELGGLKPGVGLMLDLGKDTQAGAVTVELTGKPTSFQVYAASAGVTDPPDNLDQMDKVVSAAMPASCASVGFGHLARNHSESSPKAIAVWSAT